MFLKQFAQIKYISLLLLRVLCMSVICVSFLSKFSYAQSKVPITTDSRIKTLVYNPNEVYQLKFHYGYQSFIEFGEDESIEMISIGESFAWRLTPADRRLFIRPLEIAAHTNMSIITNKRTYQFDIRSAEYTGSADEELVYVVRFFYPEPRAVKRVPPQLMIAKPKKALPAKPLKAVIRSRAEKIDISEDLTGMLKLNDRRNKLNFDYQFAGNAPNITPIKVYDNGQETSFQFKSNNLVVPNISIVDQFGKEVVTTYVNKDNYIVVPTVVGQFTLRLGNALLCVFNNKMISGR